MKLVRYGPPGKEKPGLIDADGKLRDLSRKVNDIDGDALAPRDARASCASSTPKKLPLVKGKPRLGAVRRQRRQVRRDRPQLRRPRQGIRLADPRESDRVLQGDHVHLGPERRRSCCRRTRRSTDWEVELGVVIGRTARYVTRRTRSSYVAGYCVCNDVSEREFQIERGGGQWDKGKGCDTFGPIGPWLVTHDEITDPQNLDMWLDVNGETQQNGNTRTMIFGVAHLVSYVSRFMTLMPGDMITTGTPPGVGLGMKPTPQFLKAGDVVDARHRGPGRAEAEGRPVQGEEEAVCGACHGVNGVSVADNIPNLAGQRVAYLEAQLRALNRARARTR